MTDVINELEQNKALIDIVGYFDIKRLVQYLAISPEYYECADVYDYIYDTAGGIMDDRSLTEATDALDYIYRMVVDKVAQQIKRKYVHEPYIFHRWVDPKTAIIGNVRQIAPWE